VLVASLWGSNPHPTSIFKKVKEENELIKNHFVDLSQPTEKGSKKLPRENEVEVGIHFDMSVMTNKQLDKLFQAEQLLNDIGITFDTSVGGGERDWDWDWSLKGPVNVTFRRMVKDNPKNRYVREFLPKANIPDSDSGKDPIDDENKK